MASWRDAGLPVAAVLEGLAALAAARGDGAVALAAHAAGCGVVVLALRDRLVFWERLESYYAD